MITVFDDFDECLKEYERVRPWVLNTLWYEDSGMTERDVMEGIGSRKLILLTIPNAYALISFCHSDEHYGFVDAFDIEDTDKYLLLHMIGGRMNSSIADIFAHLDEVEEYAKAKGYRKIIAIGRKGWKRFVQQYGFTTEPHNEKQNKYIKEVD